MRDDKERQRGKMTSTADINTEPPASGTNSKPTFRKVTHKKPHSLRSTKAASDDSDPDSNFNNGAEQNTSHDKDATNEDSMLETILANKRKRDLKQTLRMHEKKLQHATAAADKEPATATSTLRKRASNSVGVLNDTFATAKLGGSNRNKNKEEEEEFDESTDLGKKHKDAMEEYIQGRMQTREAESTAELAQDDSKDRKNTKLDEESLYRELSSKIITQGEDAAGNIVSFSSTGSKITSKEEASAAAVPSTIQEGDLGSGGTMLGGTGIAEVILPIDQRLGVVRATQEAVMERMRRYGAGTMQQPSSHASGNKEKQEVEWKSVLPMSFESGPAKKRRFEERATVPGAATIAKPTKTASVTSSYATSGARPSASSAGSEVLPSDVEAVSASYAHNYQFHTHEWVSRRKEERTLELEQQRLAHEAAEGPAGNRERIGFAALRGKEQAGTDGQRASDAEKARNTATSSSRDLPNDNRVWSRFVKYQREHGGRRR